ncbi:hypothetical protein NRB20_15290 [Nocardia sp. RB20]|uniref:Uncharacterized protein n=1 Tax=Nocardia macrotermitis TaxID=2585198 RepID=A0A7K0CY72_9NOCA|nr:hypothetical protein [Nocardia macrotermitis]
MPSIRAQFPQARPRSGPAESTAAGGWDLARYSRRSPSTAARIIVARAGRMIQARVRFDDLTSETTSARIPGVGPASTHRPTHDHQVASRPRDAEGRVWAADMPPIRAEFVRAPASRTGRADCQGSGQDLARYSRRSPSTAARIIVARAGKMIQAGVRFDDLTSETTSARIPGVGPASTHRPTHDHQWPPVHVTPRGRVWAADIPPIRARFVRRTRIT